MGRVESSGLKPIQRPRIQTASGMPAQFYVGDGINGLNSIAFRFAKDGFIDLALQSTVVTGASGKAAFYESV